MESVGHTEEEMILRYGRIENSNKTHCRHAIRHIHRMDRWSGCGRVQNLPMEVWRSIPNVGSNDGMERIMLCRIYAGGGHNHGIVVLSPTHPDPLIHLHTNLRLQDAKKAYKHLSRRSSRGTGRQNASLPSPLKGSRLP